MTFTDKLKMYLIDPFFFHIFHQLFCANCEIRYKPLENTFYPTSLYCCEKCYFEDKDFAEGWYNKGRSLYELSKPDESLECYEKATELNKNHKEAWNNKGFLFEIKKE